MPYCDFCGNPIPHIDLDICKECLKKRNEEDADLHLKGLKNTLERAKREEKGYLQEMDASRYAYNKAVEYRRRCQAAVEDYKRDRERRTDALHMADRLEMTAKNLREHPETFGEAEFCQNRPMEYVDQHYPYFVDNTPVVTTFKMTTWPQRKVAKEGESK